MAVVLPLSHRGIFVQNFPVTLKGPYTIRGNAEEREKLPLNSFRGS